MVVGKYNYCGVAVGRGGAIDHDSPSVTLTTEAMGQESLIPCF